MILQIYVSIPLDWISLFSYLFNVNGYNYCYVLFTNHVGMKGILNQSNSKEVQTSTVFEQFIG